MLIISLEGRKATRTMEHCNIYCNTKTRLNKTIAILKHGAIKQLQY